MTRLCLNDNEFLIRCISLQRKRIMYIYEHFGGASVHQDYMFIRTLPMSHFLNLYILHLVGLENKFNSLNSFNARHCEI